MWATRMDREGDPLDLGDLHGYLSASGPVVADWGHERQASGPRSTPAPAAWCPVLGRVLSVSLRPGRGVTYKNASRVAIQTRGYRSRLGYTVAV